MPPPFSSSHASSSASTTSSSGSSTYACTTHSALPRSSARRKVDKHPTIPSNECVSRSPRSLAANQSHAQRLPADAPNDLTPLTDVNWVSSILESLATSPSPRSRVPPSWPSAPQTTRDPPVSLAGLDLLEGGKRVLPRWEGEGRVLEVMEVESVTG